MPYKPEELKVILVGNKCDLINERKLSIQEGQNLANQYNIKFFETSTKEGTNVDELFSYIVKEIHQENNPNKNFLESKKCSSKSKKIIAYNLILNNIYLFIYLYK